ncbi:MAG TPA: phosphatase PAP2 family protein, partial [Chitinophagaceae bacterium]|nr:phosphatase PAP2 family protein [Chitinophagaceae bacterium]
AFATATSLTLITKKWYVAVPAYSWASLVGYSRMYLGVHYPADVLGGALLGTGSAFLSYKINQWLHPEKKKLKNPND